MGCGRSHISANLASSITRCIATKVKSMVIDISASSSLAPTPEEFSKINGGNGAAFPSLLSRWEHIIRAVASKYQSSINDHDDFCQVGRWALYRAVSSYVADKAAFS